MLKVVKKEGKAIVTFSEAFFSFSPDQNHGFNKSSSDARLVDNIFMSALEDIRSDRQVRSKIRDLQEKRLDVVKEETYKRKDSPASTL